MRGAASTKHEARSKRAREKRHEARSTKQKSKKAKKAKKQERREHENKKQEAKSKKRARFCEAGLGPLQHSLCHCCTATTSGTIVAAVTVAAKGGCEAEVQVGILVLQRSILLLNQSNTPRAILSDCLQCTLQCIALAPGGDATSQPVRRVR